MKKISMIVFIAIFGLTSLYAKSREELEKDLQSNDDVIVIKAIKELSEKQEGWSKILIIGKLTDNNPQVRIAAAAAIGEQDDNKPESKSHMKNLVVSDKDNAVVYAALLSLLNLAEEGKTDSDSLTALDYVEKNKASDQHLADAAKRLREKLNKK